MLPASTWHAHLCRRHRCRPLLAEWGSLRRSRFEHYLAQYSLCFPDEELCALWAQVRYEAEKAGRAIGVADAWIAATALYLEAPLATHNAKDFRAVRNLIIRTADSTGPD